MDDRDDRYRSEPYRRDRPPRREEEDDDLRPARDRGYPPESRRLRDPPETRYRRDDAYELRRDDRGPRLSRGGGFEDAFEYIRDLRESEPPQKAPKDVEHNLKTVEKLLIEIRSNRIPLTYGEWEGFLDRIEENLPLCELFERGVLLRGGNRNPNCIGENISKSINRYRNSYGFR